MSAKSLGPTNLLNRGHMKTHSSIYCFFLTFIFKGCFN